MNLAVNTRMALKSLRTNKMRAILTMLGIIIGISSVIAILTVGNALTGSVSSSFNVLGSSNVIMSLQQRNQVAGPAGGLQGQASTKRPETKDLITDEMIQAMRQRFASQIAYVSLIENVGAGQAKDGRLYNNVTVLGANADYAPANNVKLVKGRFLTDSDVKAVRAVAVVSDRLAANLYGADTGAALGKEVKVYVGGDIDTFTIAGVYEYEASTLSVSQVAEKDIRTNLYIPVTTGKRLDAGTAGYQSITVTAASDVDPIAFSTRLKTFYATYYAANPDYQVAATSLKTITEQVNTVMGSLSIAISVIAGISLLVGGIGVMNIMLVSVTERTREIGLRKAVGATPNNIRVQFIVESIIVCLIGGLFGVLLGSLLGYIGSWLLKSPGLPTPSSIAIAVGFSMSIGLFFGFYPADRAARLNPIDALRSL